MTDYAYLFHKKEIRKESVSESIFTAVLMLVAFVVIGAIIYSLPHAL